MSKQNRKMLNVILSGASGRMGQALQGLVQAERNVSVVAHVNSAADWRSLTPPKSLSVVIDFSSPEGLKQALQWCVRHKVKLVSGTTGLGRSHYQDMARAGKKIPILYSANMSLGIAAFSAMLNTLGRLKAWDFQISETHHKRKKDKPSGTALMLQRQLEAGLGRKLPRPLSTRGGGVAGIHRLSAFGPDEALVLEHTAFDRVVFARGALQAAAWLFDKKAPGLYDLGDLYKY